MEIKVATIEHLEGILEIENESFIHPWSRSDWEYELTNNPTREMLVAIENDKVIGFADIWVTFDTSSIAQIATKKEFRRQHIAETLYNKIEEKLISQNVEYVTLEVRKSNINAQNLYQKLGFKSIVIKPQYYDNGEDAIYMVKELATCL